MQPPEFDFPEGPAPTELVIEDLQVGDGIEAGPGQTVTVHYAGIDFETGEQFDSSWDRGESIEFRLKGLIKLNQSLANFVQYFPIVDLSVICYLIQSSYAQM
jgi:hypothetical protein